MEVQEAPVIVFHVCYEIDTGFLSMTFFKTVLGTVVLVLFFFKFRSMLSSRISFKASLTPALNYRINTKSGDSILSQFNCENSYFFIFYAIQWVDELKFKFLKARLL